MGNQKLLKKNTTLLWMVWMVLRNITSFKPIVGEVGLVDSQVIQNYFNIETKKI
jgi:hypothetical protein